MLIPAISNHPIRASMLKILFSYRHQKLPSQKPGKHYRGVFPVFDESDSALVQATIFAMALL